MKEERGLCHKQRTTKNRNKAAAAGAGAFKHKTTVVYLKFNDQDLQDEYANVPF
jgi:hypothetical protein